MLNHEISIMENKYTITGMTCGGCVAKVKKQLEEIPHILYTNIQLDSPQGLISSDKEIPVLLLQNKLTEKGNYKIEKIIENKIVDLLDVKASTYKPLFLIVIFILGVSILNQYPFNNFDLALLMRHFMAGFFIVFSFFKLLNLKGFSNSYAMYDIVAAKWKGWGIVYPFVELGLGIFYLINVQPILINWITIIVLGVSSIGVIQSNLKKQKIKCACLGDVFNLPMSTVTIVEDLLMVLMAVLMLA
jgi:copper chaperone CopZ